MCQIPFLLFFNSYYFLLHYFCFAHNDILVYLYLIDKDGNAKNGYSKENLESFRKYAIKVSENAVKEMADGVIVSSPIEDACKYCDYFGICQKNLEPREVIKAKDTNILDAIGFEGGNTNE